MLSTTRQRLATVGTVTAAVLAVGVATLPAGAAENAPAAMTKRSDVKPPPGSTKIGTFDVVTGTQNYTCGSAGTWGSSTPKATLRGKPGEIDHFAGPSWQFLPDGSLVTAAAVASSPRPGAIPELLLQVNGRSGDGLLTAADHIQRLKTSGGLAPSGSCTAGQTASVPYGATYVFWDAP